MITPAKSLRNFRFCTLAGVADVRTDAGHLIGQWRGVLTEFYGPPSRRLIEDFLNWHDDREAIVRFTRKYGPLHAKPVAGSRFREDLVAFGLAQTQMRELWVRLNRFPDWKPDEGGSLAFHKGFITYTAPNLYMFLYMDMVTLEYKRARKCGRTDCPHPHFIARHLKQTFCSEVCAQWGQREWKKGWWEAHGTEWRAERRRQAKKGGKDVTSKAR